MMDTHMEKNMEDEIEATEFGVRGLRGLGLRR